MDSLCSLELNIIFPPHGPLNFSDFRSELEKELYEQACVQPFLDFARISLCQKKEEARPFSCGSVVSSSVGPSLRAAARVDERFSTGS